MKCKICDSSMESCFNAVVLKKYNVNYFYCNTCGFLQSEEPYWLDEAYNNAISNADTGLVQRNLYLSKRVASLLYFFFDKQGRYLDIAGGYGMFTRLMRDYGFDYYWMDVYCQNLLAKGFELSDTNPPFNCVTAFEVLEHVHDPISFLQKALMEAKTSSIIFSTELFNNAPPSPESWWYYAFNAGQHVSFYKRETLKYIASVLKLNLYTNNNIHMLTTQTISTVGFKLLTRRFSGVALEYIKRNMQSKTFSDHQDLINNLTSKQ